jgi:plasmid maintenance system antidote protein VapI
MVQKRRPFLFVLTHHELSRLFTIAFYNGRMTQNASAQPIVTRDAQLAALRAVMAQGGWQQHDLARLLGSRSRASEILHGKRGLSQAQLLTLHQAWGIRLERLMAAPAAAAVSSVEIAVLVQASLARFAARRRLRF